MAETTAQQLRELATRRASQPGGGDQLAFDIEGMIHAARIETAPKWTGAPLNYTTAFYPPAQLDAAIEHWQFLHARDTTHTKCRMWRRSITVPDNDQVSGHGFVLYTADLRCEPWKYAEEHEDCSCFGALMYQAVCEPCAWNAITDSENGAVEMWHDHALTGWRELPIVPSRLRRNDSSKLAKATQRWVTEQYPTSMQVPGAPIITERQRFGTRHVPGRSPWGGYDLSHTAVDPGRIVE